MEGKRLENKRYSYHFLFNNLSKDKIQRKRLKYSFMLLKSFCELNMGGFLSFLDYFFLNKVHIHSEVWHPLLTSTVTRWLTFWHSSLPETQPTSHRQTRMLSYGCGGLITRCAPLLILCFSGCSNFRKSNHFRSCQRRINQYICLQINKRHSVWTFKFSVSDNKLRESYLIVTHTLCWF